MKNGIYHYAIELQSPIGSRIWRMALSIRDDIVTGTLTLFGQTLPILSGSCTGRLIRFTGEMQTLLYTLPYRAEGILEDASTQLRFKTEKGCFSAVGSAIDPDGGQTERA